MISLDPRAAARAAAAPRPDRPATATLLDTPDVRLLVFRLAPGQEVAPHRNASSVTIQVLEGRGEISGPDGARVAAAAGQVVAFEPNELHGMRATAESGDFLLMAAITPRPGGR